MDLSTYGSASSTTTPTSPRPRGHIWSTRLRQLGGADHPQAGPPALARSHPLQRAALLGADRAAAA